MLRQMFYVLTQNFLGHKLSETNSTAVNPPPSHPCWAIKISEKYLQCTVPISRMTWLIFVKSRKVYYISDQIVH